MPSSTLTAPGGTAGGGAGRPPAGPGGRRRRREGGGFVVVGRTVERAVGLSDLTDPDAMALVQRRLKRLGVDRALRRAGARPGDDVRIGQLSFTYSEDT